MRYEPRAGRAVVLLAAAVLSACDGGGPTVAKLPPTFALVSGETRQPAGGARVVVGGQTQMADRAGRVFLSPLPVATSEIDVFASGFLERRTTFGQRDDGDELTLWPLTSPQGITQEFTRETVYTNAAIGANRTPGGEPMRRWAPGISRVDVVLLGPDDNPGYLPFSEEILARQRDAIAEINAAIGGRVVYGPPREGDDAPAAATLRIRIFPAWSYCVDNPNVNAATVSDRAAIRWAMITYCRTTPPALGTMLHELGHTFGYAHSSARTDIMHAGARTTATFSERERATMKLMLQRPPGNRFPDDDRTALSAASSRPSQILCE